MLCGTARGELIVVRYGDFEVVWRKIVCSGEVVSVKCYGQRTVLGSSDGSVYFWAYNTTILQS